MTFIKGFFKTPEEGAQTTLYLACSDDVKDITGKYFYDCKMQNLQNYITIPQEHKILCKLYFEELFNNLLIFIILNIPIVGEESSKIVRLTENDPKI